MKRYSILTILIIVLMGFMAIAQAADIMQSPEGKLFGIVVKDKQGATPSDFNAQYEKSWTTAAFVAIDWGKCEPNASNGSASTYDFSSLDNDPLVKSAKTKICSINLAHPWADALKQKDSDLYWQFADAFISAAVKHANELGITHFEVTETTEWAPVHVESLKHIYKAAKAVSANNVVIGGSASCGDKNGIQAIYDAGAKGYFDVLSVCAPSNDPRTGIDMFYIVAAHRKMEKNGDGNKQIFVSNGWRASGDADAMRLSLENGYRNILTDRDIYDPKWVLGARFTATSDTPAMNNLLINLPPTIPAHSFDAKLPSEDLLFSYITGKPYKLSAAFAKTGTVSANVDKFNARYYSSDGTAIEISPNNGAAPTADGTADFSIIFPKEAGKKEVTLVAEADYTVDGVKHVDDVWTTVTVTSRIELALLPVRYIFNSAMEPSHSGMSIINNSEAAFEGKVTLKATPGMTVSPTEIAVKVDSHGLEIYRFDVTPDENAAPGHYTVFAEVEGQASEWAIVDVPVLARKVANKFKDTKEWESIAAVAISKDSIGKFAYDDLNLYAVFEIEDKKHVPSEKLDNYQQFWQNDSLVIAFDPLINGARTNNGGYKEDDFEVDFASLADGKAVAVTQTQLDSISFAFRRDGTKSIYEIALPWSVMKSFEPGKDKTFALSVLINNNDGDGRTYSEWGGGVAEKKDPRLFIPVLLTE